LLAEEAKPTERCSVFVEPVSVLGQIQIGETYTNKCIRQGHTPRRRRTERRKAAAGGTHNHTQSQSQVIKFPPRAMRTNYTLRLCYCPRPSQSQSGTLCVRRTFEPGFDTPQLRSRRPGEYHQAIRLSQLVPSQPVPKHQYHHSSRAITHVQ